ncbi:MAG TPA: hypothetical protein VFV71_11195 [Burkholderiales bacterium]|nr:hypothetical protein [Burkholderiales bacterium]
MGSLIGHRRQAQPGNMIAANPFPIVLFLAFLRASFVFSVSSWRD